MFLALCLAASSTSAQSVGVFFDENAETCTARLEPFGASVRAHVLALVEDGSEITGAFMSIKLPDGVVIVPESIQYPERQFPIVVGNDIASDEGIDLQFTVCQQAAGPILLVSFDLADQTFGGPEPRPDLVVEKGGGVIVADSTQLEEPHLKTCDPDNREGFLEIFRAPGLVATLNCSHTSCPCTPTAISHQRWFTVKQHYRKP